MAQSKYVCKRKTPKIGAFFNSIGAFSEEGRKKEETAFSRFFSLLKKDKIISNDSILWEKRTFHSHDVKKALVKFASSRVDAVILVDSAFPNGNAFSTLAGDPYLAKIPIIITSDYEPEFKDNREWTTNAWCGVIMNNYAAKHMNRFVYPLAGYPLEKKYIDEFKMALKAFAVIATMRDDYLIRFGDMPSGFHSATQDELLLTTTFGTRIESVDVAQVLYTYEKREARGLFGIKKFTEQDVEKTTREIMKDRPCLVPVEMVNASMRLYHAYKALIELNGGTSAAFKCWPELQSEHIFKYTPCLAMGKLLADGIISGAGCEADVITTIAQSLGTYLSGLPAACLDFVNYTGGSEVVQLGHCGVGIPGCMEKNPASIPELPDEKTRKNIEKGKIKINDAIGYSSPPKQVGFMTGPNLIGQFVYGKKTGIAMAPDGNRKFKMLVFTGESSPSSAKHMLYSASDIAVKDYKRLNEIILQEGFPHHLAVAVGDISSELKILCEYYGIKYFEV